MVKGIQRRLAEDVIEPALDVRADDGLEDRDDAWVGGHAAHHRILVYHVAELPDGSPLPHHPRVLLPLPQRLPPRRLLLRIADRPASPRVVDVSGARVLRAEHLLRLAEVDGFGGARGGRHGWTVRGKVRLDLRVYRRVAGGVRRV